MKDCSKRGLWQVVDSTNVFYLPIINKSSSFDKSINVSVLPNAEAKSHPIDITFTYEYVLNGVRQKGEMTQQVSVQTMQPDRFTVDPIADLLESSVGGRNLYHRKICQQEPRRYLQSVRDTGG